MPFERTELVVFERATVTENDYGEEVLTWGSLASRRARVRFGTAQEKREAAQEGGVQSITLEVVRSPVMDSVTLRDRLTYLGSEWDIVEAAPLDRKNIRFTAVRTL